MIGLSASKESKHERGNITELLKKLVLSEREAECAQDCPISWIGDGICNFACFVEECQYDLLDCDNGRYEGEEECSPGCPDSWVDDGICDDECYVEDCYFDFDDCLKVDE